MLQRYMVQYRQQSILLLKHPDIRPKPQYPFHGLVKRSTTLPILFLLTGYGVQKLILIKICKLENPLQLPQFTKAAIKEITTMKKSLTQSSEMNVNTKIPWDATTPLHPVLPTVTAEIPIVTTAREPSITVPRFLHTAMTMTAALSLQNQLQKLTES